MPTDITGTEVHRGEPGRGSGRSVSSGDRSSRTFCWPTKSTARRRRRRRRCCEAMQEHQVTVGRTAPRHCAEPFFVLATQNPIEQEGTYPLPEAQLDRFLLQIDVGYPDLVAERKMLYATTGNETPKLEAVISAQELMATQRLVRQIPVPDKVVEAILKLVRAARPGTGADSDTDRFVAWGPGPRASQALMLAVRAKALIDGRLAPSVDDVIALAEPILKHRMALNFAARAEGEDLTRIIARLASSVE